MDGRIEDALAERPEREEGDIEFASWPGGWRSSRPFVNFNPTHPLLVIFCWAGGM